MRAWNKKLPALLLSATLLASFTPAWPGGRDVPDRKSNGSSSSEDYGMPGDGETWCSENLIATTISFGGISLDIAWTPEGSLRLQPTLLSDATLVLRRALGRDDSSCPTD